MFKDWLASKDHADDSGDVEGEASPDSDPEDQDILAPRRALRWRGPDARETSVADATQRISPSDVYVIPISTEAQRSAALLLGDFPTDGQGRSMLADAGDAAYQRSRDFAILRLRHDLTIPSIRPSTAALARHDGR